MGIKIIKIIYRYSGVESICNKARVIEEKQPKRMLPSLPIWLIGIYIALFGLASQRYENRVDIIERKVTSIYARLTPITSAITQLPPVIVTVGDSGTAFVRDLFEYEELKFKKPNTRVSISEEEHTALLQRNKLVLAKKNILSKIPEIQRYPCPSMPSIFNPLTTIHSLFVNTIHKETVNELKEIIVDFKEDLLHANLDNVNLESADLYEANIKFAFLKEANLENANLVKANLECTDLLRAKLKGAQLGGADLGGSHLGGADLENANLLAARLKDSGFKYANFRNANLELADFEGAYLGYADFEGANLALADFEGAYFGYAKLKGTKNLTIEQLSKVKTLYKAKLDTELMKQVKEKYPHLLEEPKEE